MVAQIERSAGVIVHVGSVPYAVGSGYRGETTALDDAVSAGAEALMAMFDHPVTIRFNSDHQSGGAWLKTAEIDSLSVNCEIEIGAMRHDLTEIKERLARNKAKWGWDDDFEAYCADCRIDPNGPNEQIVFVSYIKADYLRDPSLVNQGEGEDRKSYVRHLTLEAAIAFVRDNAVADPRPVTAMRKRRAAAALATKVQEVRKVLEPLNKAQLHAITWRLPYGYRPPGFGFKPSSTKETKDALRGIILRAVRDRQYTYDPAHLQPRF